MATGVWVIICAMTPILQRDEEGVVQWGEGGMKAQPAKAEEEREVEEGVEQHSKAAGTQTEKRKQISLYCQQGKNLLCFYITAELALQIKDKENLAL